MEVKGNTSRWVCCIAAPLLALGKLTVLVNRFPSSITACLLEVEVDVDFIGIVLLIDLWHRFVAVVSLLSEVG